MKRGHWLWVMGWIGGLAAGLAGRLPAQTTRPAESPSAVPSEYDITSPEMRPEEWTEPVEPPTAEPTTAPDEESRALEFLQKHMPYYHDRLVELKKQDAEAYQRALEYFQQKARQLLAMPEAPRADHVRHANLWVDILRTGREYHEAKSDADRDKRKTDMEKLLSEKFDLEQKMGEYRLKHLDEKLNQCKQKLQDRARDRRKILAEELRCRLQTPAQPAAETQPASQPAPKEDKPAPTTQPTEPSEAPSTQPAATTQPT
ncbi:MAG: hypothetical protein JXA11_12300 [Phycisphaerae bacterium]|nr:hypothetical protein [Phycisphaerae bacterium]